MIELSEASASRLACPFLVQGNHGYCITTVCMAWSTTKTTDSIDYEYITCRCGESTNQNYSCQKCETRASEDYGIKVRTENYGDLEESEHKGYCERIGLHDY